MSAGYRVETFGRDCLGNITGYRVVNAEGVTVEQFIGNVYRAGSVERARWHAYTRAAALNEGARINRAVRP